jgi:hypothetical protein
MEEPEIIPQKIIGPVPCINMELAHGWFLWWERGTFTVFFSAASVYKV